MAKETMGKTRILDIDTSQAQKSVSDLRKEVVEYKKALDSSVVGSEENKKAAMDLANAQTALKAAQQGAIDATGTLNGSYHALSVEMKRLKDAQKQIDVSTKEGMEAFKNSAKEINAINEKLKDLDAQNGVFSRNVGDYANQFGAAMTSMGASTGVLSKGLKGVKGVLDVLKAHPIIAIVAVVIALIKKLVDAVKKNEESYNRLKIALAPINGLMNLIATATDKLATKFVELTEKVMDFAGKVVSKLGNIAKKLGFDGLADSIENATQKLKEFTDAATQIETREANLAKKQRDILVENARLNKEMAKERAIAADKETYNAKERLEAVKKAGALEQKIAQNNLKLAKEELSLLKLKAAQSPNDKEANDALAAAEAKVYQVQEQADNITRSINKQISTISKEVKTQAKAFEDLENAFAAKPADTYEKELQNAINAKTLEYDAIREKYEEAEKQQLISHEERLEREKQIDIKLATEIATLKAKAANEATERALEETSNNDSAIIKAMENEAQIRRMYNQQTIEDERALQEDILAIKLEGLQRYLDYYDEQSENAELSEQDREAYLKKYKDMYNQIESLKAEHTKTMIDLDKQEKDEMFAYLQENIAIFEESFGRLISITDGVSSKWGEVLSEFDAGFMDLAKSLKDGEKGWEKYGRAAATALQVGSTILAALADEQDETTKQGFEMQKKMNIAAATMSMFSGIMAAWSSAMELPFPANVIIGAIETAATAALGGVQIANIKKQQFGGSDSGNINTPSANTAALAAAATNQNYENTMASANIQEKIGNQRVYVVESDIREVGNRVKVSEEESMF